MRTIAHLGVTEFIFSEEEMSVIREWSQLVSDTRIRLTQGERQLIEEIGKRSKPLAIVLENSGLLEEEDELFPGGFAEGLV